MDSDAVDDKLWSLGLQDLFVTSLVLWAHIRDIDWDFIESLCEQMVHGWTVTSMICVVELGLGKDGKMKYGVVDGAHRVTTAQRLIEKNLLPADMVVPARIYKQGTPTTFLLAKAMLANDGQDRNTVLVTMFHRFWWVYTMAKVVMEGCDSVKKMTFKTIAQHAGTEPVASPCPVTPCTLPCVS
jgi:hypothetical protein